MFRGYMTKLKYIFLSFFTNQEDPVPPEWFKPDIENIYIRKIFWWFRNPAHNFFWRVIGIVDEINKWKVTGDYPTHVWNPNGGWNILTFTHKQTGKKKYFKSYRGKRIEFYFGIRYNGAYGYAFRRVLS